MRKDTIKPIISYLKKNQPATVKQMVEELGMSKVIIHKYLLYALKNGLVIKYGSTPRVWYSLAVEDFLGSQNAASPETHFSYDQTEFLESNFLQFDVNGKTLQGVDGFITRCNQRSLNVQKTYKEYHKHISMINKLRDSCGMLHAGFKKFLTQVKNSFIDDLLYCDVYQLAQFGKSRLGNLAFYAKQSQSQALLDQTIARTKGQILCHVSQHKYDAVCFIPHSLKRPLQILDALKKGRNINLPAIELKKMYSGTVIIPQKSIKGTEQRIRNARETIFLLAKTKTYKHILLIDDFVGSGASMNESARKLIEGGVAKKVTGLALVGNIDMSYEVLSEV